MFKWIKKLFQSQPVESTPAPQIDPEDQELIDAYSELVKKHGFLEFMGNPSAWDETITSERLIYQTFVNGWYKPEGARAIQAERSEITEYWDQMLHSKRSGGFDVIVWRIMPTVYHAEGSDPLRVRLRCAFTTKDKVKPHLLKS